MAIISCCGVGINCGFVRYGGANTIGGRSARGNGFGHSGNASVRGVVLSVSTACPQAVFFNPYTHGAVLYIINSIGAAPQIAIFHNGQYITI